MGRTIEKIYLLKNKKIFIIFIIHFTRNYSTNRKKSEVNKKSQSP